MDEPDGIPWSIDEIDREMDRLARQLRGLTNYKARAIVLDRTDVLLDRRLLLARSARKRSRAAA